MKNLAEDNIKIQKQNNLTNSYEVQTGRTNTRSLDVLIKVSGKKGNIAF